MNYFTTKHSIERMKSRLNINERKAEKRLFDAITRGECADAFSSRERAFLANEGRNGCVAVAYDGYCYILNADNICVTLYPLPAWFGKKKRFDGKTKIRKVKRYYRNHPEKDGNIEVSVF